MIEELDLVTRSSIVSSQDRREFDERVYTELSNLYHRTLAIIGRANTVSLCLGLTNSALLNTISSLQISQDPMVVTVDARTLPLYPTVSEQQQAERFSDFRVITARRVHSVPVFVTETGQIRAGVEMTRTTANALHMARPSTIVENTLTGILTGDAPYLIKFSYPQEELSNLTLNISSTTTPFSINAVRIVPMPVVGSISLVYMKHSTLLKPVLNGNIEFPDISGNEDPQLRTRRSFPAYIHFKQIDTSVLRFAFESRLYLQDKGAVVIGISSMLGEMNVYALKSYIGWEINVPSGATKIIRTHIYSDNYAESVVNARLKVYSDLVEFNRVSNDYLLSSVGDTLQDVPIGSGTTKLYALLDIDSVDNSTPCIGRIEVEFA